MTEWKIRHVSDPKILQVHDVSMNRLCYTVDGKRDGRRHDYNYSAGLDNLPEQGIMRPSYEEVKNAHCKVYRFCAPAP